MFKQLKYDSKLDITLKIIDVKLHRNLLIIKK